MEELDIDRQALVETFLAEAEETFAGMEQALVSLEARPEDPELLHSLFRAAHTLKGSAALVDFGAIRDLAHELESLLERLRARTLPVTSALVTLLLQATDALRDATASAAGGRADSSPAEEAMRARLRQAAGATPAAGSASAPDAPSRAAGASTLRVDVGRLDRMMNLSGEIAIARSHLTDMLERRTTPSVEEILQAHREADRLYGDLQDLIMKARMVPLGPVFQQHLRTVRDLAFAQGKQARLVVEGADVEVDTAVVEHVRDPLTHMIRNALDHGIEPPEVRRAAGKDSCGRVALRALQEGGTIVIQVADDGAGLPKRRIAERGRALGLVADAALVTDEEIGRLVFEPGLSTSDRVTEISGRGVGMDVVRRNVEALHGSVAVESEEGKGTCVTLRLPLTLAIIQGFEVSVGDARFILPLDAVTECLEMPAEGKDGAGSRVIDLRGRPLPVLRLRDHLGVEGRPPPRENVVVVRHGRGLAGLAVDALLGESQSVIKPLGRMFQGLPGIAGSSILGDGTVALILDVAGLMREALAGAAAG